MAKLNRGAHGRNFFQVVGRFFDQTTVPFLIPDLQRDVPFGVYVTVALARGHDHPEVRAMYDDMCRYMAEFERFMKDHRRNPSMMTLRRLKNHTAVREPHEARLGYTKVGSRGRALGKGALQAELLDFFTKRPDLLRDCTVEPDTLSYASNFGIDRVSDVVVAVCKRRLVAFTQWCATFFAFDPRCMKEVQLENVWQPERGTFGTETHVLPVDDNGDAILLVPTDLVRSAPPLSAEAYFSAVYGDNYDGPRGKRAVLDDAAQHPGRLGEFAKDWLRDPERYKNRRNLRPPKPGKRRRKKK